MTWAYKLVRSDADARLSVGRKDRVPLLGQMLAEPHSVLNTRVEKDDRQDQADNFQQVVAIALHCNPTRD